MPVTRYRSSVDWLFSDEAHYGRWAWALHRLTLATVNTVEARALNDNPQADFPSTRLVSALRDLAARLDLPDRDAYAGCYEDGGGWSEDYLGQIWRSEREFRHDVVGFVEWVRAGLDPELQPFLWLRLTSSDLVDTGRALLAARASACLSGATEALRDACAAKALALKDTVRVARTHGQYAEPVSAGRVWAVAAANLDEHRVRLHVAADLPGKASGPVGDHRYVGYGSEVRALHPLRPDDACHQTVDRAAQSRWAFEVLLLCARAAQVAGVVRSGARSEVGEWHEGKAPGQRGSSSMPHKTNPVRSERVVGLARLARGDAAALLDLDLLWDERDISHSSVDREALSRLVRLTCFALEEMTQVVTNLQVDREGLARHVQAQGSWSPSHEVWRLVGLGYSHESAYEEVAKPGYAFTAQASDRLPGLLATSIENESRLWGRVERWAEHAATPGSADPP